MLGYLDSSVALRRILLGEAAIFQVFNCESVVSSELLEVECRRVIYRYRMDGDIDDEGLIQAFERLEMILKGISILALSRTIKKRAMGPFPVSIKTLDALHLASALVLAENRQDETILIFSHDVAMNRCARALGFSTPFLE
ncbi:MAG: hypothetical protein DRP87_01380 [Spirochaetes bacterium]|nr:MAG: hypothetical protein DRP87_01380 [Spirochaetota bacterium]